MAAISSALNATALSPSGRAHSKRHAEELAREHRVLDVRIQAAVVRSLLDELERLVPSGVDAESLQGQVLEELARLGSLILEMTSEFASADGDRSVPAASEPRIRLRRL